MTVQPRNVVASEPDLLRLLLAQHERRRGDLVRQRVGLERGARDSTEVVEHEPRKSGNDDVCFLLTGEGKADNREHEEGCNAEGNGGPRSVTSRAESHFPTYTIRQIRPA